MSGTFDPYVSWLSKDEDGIRAVVANVRDRPSVADLLAFLDREAQGVPLDEIVVRGGHVSWQRPATDAERAERVEFRDRAKASEEEWQRAALLRFLAKYGVPEEYR